MKAGLLKNLLDRPVLAARSFLSDPGQFAVFLFGVEIVTGSLLALYYRPSPDAAFGSVQLITNSVTFGWLVRSIHLTAGNAVVALALVLVLRAFFRRAFLGPRGLAGWLLVLAFFAVMVAFLFTGEALPWDQEAYWRTVVSANLIGETPVVGPWLADVLRSGDSVSGRTLVRLYAAHALLLPWATFWIIIQMRRLLRQGAVG